MPRKRRIEKVGFNHIINRGVERRKRYLDEEDHVRYLEILQDSREVVTLPKKYTKYNLIISTIIPL